MASHQMSSDQVLSMVVEQAIYPITINVLYSLFGPFGVEQLVVYPQTKSEDGEPCVAADVRFCSAHAAAHAFAYWDGRCIYFRCCRLQMWNATPDVLPAPTSPPTRMATPDAFMAGDTTASAHSTCLDPSVNNHTSSVRPTVVNGVGDGDAVTAVELNNPIAAISGHEGQLVRAVNTPATARTSTPPHVNDTSPNSNCRVLVTGGGKEAVTELAVLPDVPSSTTKVEDVLHDASLESINVKPVTCSTECSNQNKDTLAFPPPVMLVSLLPTAAPMLVADLIHLGTNIIDSMQPIRNHDLDVSGPTRHSGLLIRATPWPSLLVDHIAEGNEIRPTLWPSFPICVPSKDKSASCFSKQLFHKAKKWLSVLYAYSITAAHWSV